MVSRTLALFLAVALFAGIASSAQCFVRCVNPVAPAHCHHHPPAKQTQSQCTDSAPVVDARATIAPPAVAPNPTALSIAAAIARPGAAPEPATSLSPHPDPPLLLRI
jgi:hypothetical protein